MHNRLGNNCTLFVVQDYTNVKKQLPKNGNEYMNILCRKVNNCSCKILRPSFPQMFLAV